METVLGLLISNEAVCLDDKHFINCTLDSCELIYSGGPVIFEGTLFVKCRHTFGGPARATVAYLQHMGLMHEDGVDWTERAANIN